jgi:TonB family protein
MPPQPIRQVNPSIPDGIRNRIKGIIPIDIAVRVGTTGAVTRAEVVGKPEGLRAYLAQRTVDAVRLWKFRPARRDRKAVPGQMVVRFRFRRSETEWN